MHTQHRPPRRLSSSLCSRSAARRKEAIPEEIEWETSGAFVSQDDASVFPQRPSSFYLFEQSPTLQQQQQQQQHSSSPSPLAFSPSDRELQRKLSQSSVHSAGSTLEAIDERTNHNRRKSLDGGTLHSYGCENDVDGDDGEVGHLLYAMHGATDESRSSSVDVERSRSGSARVDQGPTADTAWLHRIDAVVAAQTHVRDSEGADGGADVGCDGDGNGGSGTGQGRMRVYACACVLVMMLVFFPLTHTHTHTHIHTHTHTHSLSLPVSIALSIALSIRRCCIGFIL